MRLGEYLIQTGRVSKTAVEMAKHAQEVNNHLIGILAVDRDWMTHDELSEVLRRQDASSPRRPFGEVAVECGYLTRGQVAALLEIQQENRLRLGEILVLQSRISEKDLLQSLDEFGDLDGGAERESA